MTFDAPAWLVRALYRGYPFLPGVTGRLAVDGVPTAVSLFVGRIIFVSR